MDSRRDFLKKAALLAGAGATGALPGSIHKAFAIDPAPGTTYLDAEHVVVLMQENRSFDHTYGTLRGVRGFNDPRAVTLPNGNPVWLQSNKNGETYAPFRLNIKDTKATWMGSLPHGWVDQGEARNHGKHDGWLDAKRISKKEYQHLPLTMGYYNRDDIPFFYAFADAFTVCDQNFCSSLTPTTPNRLHLWTGTVRSRQTADAKAHILNEDLDYDSEVSWTTFPERLEEHGVSWRIYQNEISLPSGLEGEADAWLTNFGDNPLEWFTQYRVRFSATHRNYLAEKEKALAAELETHDSPAKRAQLDQIRHELNFWTPANFSGLSPRDQNLHRKAFATNQGHPDYRQLIEFTYRDGDTERRMQTPKGDVLHQFREDVRSGQLPVVSWIVPPERFSDHPSSPWYGAWYLSETLDILTQNPEVWKKTIFILCYDENDGYFDHVPPFVAPFKHESGTGKASAGIDTSLEYAPRKPEGPIGLGFRVPLVIASPWSRGGYVCSQVFDHTSILQLLENFLTHKTGRPIRETNINDWRRAVCGDLNSVFHPHHGEATTLPAPVQRENFFSSINESQYKPIPNDFKNLGAEEITLARNNPLAAPFLPRQEKGVRPACALPYELAVDGTLSLDRKSFIIQFAAGRELFGEKAAGAPFHVYSPAMVRAVGLNAGKFEAGRAWSYTVSAGDRISDSWALSEFETGRHFLRVHGPNGFFREFRGGADDPLLAVALFPVRSGKTAAYEAKLELTNRDPQQALAVLVEDAAYGHAQRIADLAPAGDKDARAILNLNLGQSFGWHDLRIRVQGASNFEQRYAGRVETGTDSFSDPHMGRALG